MNEAHERERPAGASRDGPATLGDRVRSLRLQDQLGDERPRSGVLPWILCAILLLVRVGGPHLHLCFDGSEPPASFHAFDLAGHHGLPGIDASHDDADIALIAEFAIPITGLRESRFGLRAVALLKNRVPNAEDGTRDPCLIAQRPA